jgi:hypothetical protein
MGMRARGPYPREDRPWEDRGGPPRRDRADRGGFCRDGGDYEGGADNWRAAPREAPVRCEQRQDDQPRPGPRDAPPARDTASPRRGKNRNGNNNARLRPPPRVKNKMPMVGKLSANVNN